MKIKSFEYNVFGENTYVVWDERSRQCAIVDPGMRREREQQELDAFIAAEGLTPVHLINTHLHIDHTMGNDYVMQRYGLQTEAHPDDAFLGQQRNEQAYMFRLPYRLSELTVAVPLHEGDRIELGDESLEVLHVPGHSPGSIVLYDAVDGWAITGDVIFRGSIGRTDLPGGNHGLLLRGIRDKVLTLPLDTVLYPGHGPATTVGEELRSNPYVG